MLAQVPEFRRQMAEGLSDCLGIELGRIALPRIRAKRGWNHFSHGHFIFSVVLAETTGLHRGAMANLNPLGRKLLAVVVQPPGSHVLRRAVMHADDDVAIPRPGVVAVIFAWARAMVGSSMIPSDDFETLLASA